MGCKCGGSYGVKITVYTVNSECYSDLSMNRRINNGLIMVKCPKICKSFNQCLAKSRVVKLF